MSPQLSEVSLDLGTVRALYADGLSPGDLIREVYRRVQAKPDVGVWTALVPLDAALARAKALARLGRANLPLYGVPLSVKDNIDVRGLPTTAGCPAFAHLPEKSATVVRRMEDAGAILVGKNTLTSSPRVSWGSAVPFTQSIPSTPRASRRLEFRLGGCRRAQLRQRQSVTCSWSIHTPRVMTGAGTRGDSHVPRPADDAELRAYADHDGGRNPGSQAHREAASSQLLASYRRH
jgi:hypothetical protein